MELSFPRRALVVISIIVAIVAYFLSTRISRSVLLPLSALTTSAFSTTPFNLSKTMSARTPVYFMSHGGVSKTPIQSWSVFSPKHNEPAKHNV
jgi:hypothetical protein